MLIRRKITPLLRKRLAANPAVALVGPRQAGKTTLAHSLKGAYFDLEQEPDRLRLNLEWDALATRKGLIVLDEAQAYPDVFPKLRGAIDEHPRRRGRFLLLGSVSPALMVQVSESLAGRLALVELTPFNLSELRGVGLRTAWCRGGYPAGGVLEPGRFPQWQRDYLTLLAQRDLPIWGLAAKPQVIQRLLKMTATVHGQVWNASQLGQSLGLSYKTVDTYLDYLIGAFLIRRLPAYSRNIRKRLVKRPKVYWRDAGLLHALLNLPGEDGLLDQPWVGASWEGFVIEQILGALRLRERSAEPCFFRTSDGREIDLLLDLGNRLWAVEVKLTASPGTGDLERLDHVADLVKADVRLLVSQVPRSHRSGNRISCNLPWLLRNIATL